MRVELGTPVILRLEQPALWHIPAAAKRTLAHIEISIDASTADSSGSAASAASGRAAGTDGGREDSLYLEAVRRLA